MNYRCGRNITSNFCSKQNIQLSSIYSYRKRVKCIRSQDKMTPEHHKLVNLVGGCSPLWDRNHDKFRDQEFKAMLWNQIGQELSLTGSQCKEIFKGLREKYIREREKQTSYGSNYRPWEFLEQLQFLDPYIIARKSHSSWNMTIHEDDNHSSTMMVPKRDPSDSDTFSYERIVTGFDDSHSSPRSDPLWSKEYCKALIKLVRESGALWDRQHKDYHDKHLKDRLWQAISRATGWNANHCALRWKALREKYIRQKGKFLEGEPKWELLDDLSFLDDVIHYRKRQQRWQSDESNNGYYNASDNGSMQSRPPSDLETVLDEFTNDSTPTRPSIGSTAHHRRPPHHGPAFGNPFANLGGRPTIDDCKQSTTPDSTLDGSRSKESEESRKRKCSDANETAFVKKKDESELCYGRTAEQIFGELVAALLILKSPSERNVAMIEIMSILAKPSAS